MKNKKNRYNYPRYATNSNNTEYNQYVEDMYFAEVVPEYATEDPQMRKSGWKENGRIDIFHERHDSTDPHDDPFSVAEHFFERTTMTHGN